MHKYLKLLVFVSALAKASPTDVEEGMSCLIKGNVNRGYEVHWIDKAQWVALPESDKVAQAVGGLRTLLTRNRELRDNETCDLRSAALYYLHLRNVWSLQEEEIAVEMLETVYGAKSRASQRYGLSKVAKAYLLTALKAHLPLSQSAIPKLMKGIHGARTNILLILEILAEQAKQDEWTRTYLSETVPRRTLSTATADLIVNFQRGADDVTRQSAKQKNLEYLSRARAVSAALLGTETPESDALVRLRQQLSPAAAQAVWEATNALTLTELQACLHVIAARSETTPSEALSE